MTTESGLDQVLDKTFATVMPGVSSAWSVLGLIDKVAELFGDGHKSGERTYYGGGGADNGIDWNSPSAAEAEKVAAGNLATKTAQLQTLDSQLAALAGQIVDDNDAAKKKLTALKGEIEKELTYTKTSPDSSVVKYHAVTQFLQDKAGEVAQVVTDAAAAVAKRKGQLGDLDSQYPGDPTTPPAAPGTMPPVADPSLTPPVDPSQYGGYADPGYGYGDEYGYGDQGGFADAAGQLGEAAAGALPQMASAIPGALGGLGGGLPLGDLGSLIGAAADRGDNRARDDQSNDGTQDKQQKSDPPADGEQKKEATPPADDKQNDQKNEQTPEAKPEATPAPAPPPAPPAPTLVVRPDGTNVTAASPAVAAAARAHLGGASLEDSYKAAGIMLPPPGTPLKDTIALSQTHVGDLAQFRDRYVMLMGENKVYLDGQMQPAAALAKLTGFMGFRRAPDSVTPAVPAAAAAPIADPGAAGL